MAGPVGCALAGSTEGVWESLFKVLSQDAGFAYILVDSIIVRAHQHSANDITRIEGWLNGLRAGHVLADKGYDGQRAMCHGRYHCYRSKTRRPTQNHDGTMAQL